VLQAARSQGIDMAVIAIKEEADPGLVEHAQRLVSLVQLHLDQFSQEIVNLLTKNVNYACGTYYNWNCNCAPKVEFGHLLRCISSLAPELVFNRRL